MKMIDIIIPAYNSHDTIKKTLLSIALQSIRDIVQVTIINECSQEDYREIINTFEKKLKIREIKLEGYVELGIARQIGIDNTKNPYIMFMDSDEILYNYYSLENLYNAIKNNHYAYGTIICDLPEEYTYYGNNQECIHGKLYKRTHLEKENIRFNNTKSSEDYSFNRLVTLSTKNCAITEDLICLYKDIKNSVNDSEEYIINCMEWYIYNAIWTANEAKKRKYSNHDISILVNNALTYSYYTYLTYHKNKKASKILEWVYPLINMKDEFDKFISMEEKIDIFKEFGDAFYGIPTISLNDFISKSKKTKNKSK